MPEQWTIGGVQLSTNEWWCATCGNASAPTVAPTMPLRPGVYLVTSQGLVWLRDCDGAE